MKLAVALICFMAFASFVQGLSITDITKAIRECKRENNCNENVLRILRQNKIPETTEGLNSMYCAGVKIGLIMPDNIINADVLKSCLESLHMDSDKIPQVVADCQSKCTGPDHAEAVKSLMTCIMSH